MRPVTSTTSQMKKAAMESPLVTTPAKSAAGMTKKIRNRTASRFSLDRVNSTSTG